MFNAIKQFFLDLQLSIWLALNGAKARLADERGDTNFISIAIILIVVIAIAVVFIGFGQDIAKAFQNSINELKSKLGI